jgi:hypothetical protein
LAAQAAAPQRAPGPLVIDSRCAVHYHAHAHIDDLPELLMKTERVTLLTTPEFKAFLVAEAAREGVSVAELVRSRCEPKPDADEALLASLAGELRKAVREAQASLNSGLAEANSVLTELRARRDAAPAAKTPTRKTRKRAAGAHP